MKNILILILRFKTFLVYGILSLIAFALMVNFNHLQRSNWLHSSGAVTGSINNSTASVSDYFSLKQQNQLLALENGKLQNRVQLLSSRNKELKLNQNILADTIKLSPTLNDTLQQILHKLRAETSFINDSIHHFIPAQVIKNSTNSNTNFITINKGESDGVKEDDGIVTENGLVGRVVSTSYHYSLIKSVLHINNFVSVILEPASELGTITWDGKNIKTVSIKDIPRHVTVSNQDSLFTSGYGSVYPAKHFVGTVKKVVLEENSAFYDLEVELSVNFNRLNHVYIYRNLLSEELNNLNAQTDTIP